MDRQTDVDWKRISRFLEECRKMASQKEREKERKKEGEHKGRGTPDLELLQDYQAIGSKISNDTLREHPILRVIAGASWNTREFAEPSVSLRPLFSLDDGQERAVSAALAGRPITVIGGPPGCGKSQVVAAIMYECWVRGKSAIFIAATNEAVNVVRDRLRDSAGTSDIVARHGNNTESDLVKCWGNLSRLDGERSGSRAKKFPPSTGQQSADHQELRNLQSRLESFAPEAIEESLRTIENTVEQRRDERSRTESAEMQHRGECAKGKLQPNDPAEARNFYTLCESWLNQFSDLQAEIEHAEAERRRMLSRATELKAKCLQSPLISAESGKDVPPATGLQECELHLGKLIEATRSCRNLGSILIRRDIRGDALREHRIQPEGDQAQALAMNLGEIEYCINVATELANSDAVRKNDELQKRTTEHRHLCHWLGTMSVPPACLDAEYQNRLSLYTKEFLTARVAFRRAQIDGPITRALPFSRFRDAKKAFEKSCRSIETLIGEVATADAPATRHMADDPSIDTFLALLGKAGVLERGARVAESLQKKLTTLIDRAIAAGATFIPTDVSCKSIPDLQSSLRDRSARLRIRDAATQANALAHEFRRLRLHSDVPDDLARELFQYADGGGEWPANTSDALSHVAKQLRDIRSHASDSEAAMQDSASVPTADLLEKSWLARRPDAPGEWPRGSNPHADASAGLGHYRSELDEWLRAIERWDSRRSERMAVSSALSRGVDEARAAIDEVKLHLPTHSIALLDRATAAEDPAGWDLDAVRNLLGEATPAHFEVLQEEIRHKIKTNEQRLINDAMPAPIGRNQRDSLDRLTRSSKSSGDYSSDFREALRACPLILTTTMKTYERIPMEVGVFDMLIIDEASQATLVDTFPGLVRAKSLVVIGDQKQLPPHRGEGESDATTNDATVATSIDFEELPDRIRAPFQSIYDIAERLCRDADQAPVMLTSHYRSHPSIIGYANENFYARQLVLKRHPTPGCPSSPSGVFGKDLSGTSEKVEGSWRNPQQAEWIVSSVLERLKVDPNASIGIVCVRKPQSELIRARLEEKGCGDQSKVKVGTVDAFQGAERDHIIYNIVPVPGARDSKGTRDFDSDPKRINVAITRARDSVTIVADLAKLRNSEGHLGDLARYVERCDQLRRTSRGGLELYGWLLLDGVRIEGEPRCEPEQETVTFSVRNADGKLKRIRVVPSWHKDPDAKTESSPVLHLVSKRIMRSPRSAAAAVRRFLETEST